MNKYEKLVEKCENMGAKVYELDLCTSKPCGYCVDKNIYINSRCTLKEKYCVLLEELGHHITTYGGIINQADLKNKKQELRARRWGYEHSVSIAKIIKAFENNALNISEMSDFLGVTEKYFLECLEHYKVKYGCDCKIDNYIIQFIPHFGIYKIF